ncbi:putative Negative regulator of mitosis/putative negative regulator of mitosis [Blumeria hordei DH14]|uniref:Putative Negative regulator of mitosis/putative negative regulator of mitosis n=1 Tax=Blumeria graminis f. sp. hordei (strain DH14) TaxID=546991 RepID=N1JGU1_BLUG1|nr:putative Negative regulator of mitosis/putative negative regulator of mitosis [Blumeria hordei DH14]
MASVTSLGISSPIGLAYAIQEGYLPINPSNNLFNWINYSKNSANYPSEEDELLVTPRCVIWSRGGIFRKCYNFDVEKEAVTHALLTTFPSVDPITSKNMKSKDPTKKSENDSPWETAIVIFLKTQAHVYFLFGTSHIIHLPFEVEYAFAAPSGVVLQRKLGASYMASALKLQLATQSSFASSQSQPWSAASSQLSSFSVADLGAPKQMPLPHPMHRSMWDVPSMNMGDNWPRLFSLSDPLAEIGLITAQKLNFESREKQPKKSRILQLDMAEEILYVSNRDDYLPKGIDFPPMIAITWNQGTSKYTIWRFSYQGEIPTKEDKKRFVSGNISRRRSSYAPGATNGANTPIMVGKQFNMEGLGSSQSTNLKKNFKFDETQDKLVDLVSTLSTDFESQTVPRRKSRQVSSMLARADLSATHERSSFTDIANNLPHAHSKRIESYGSQHTRTSIGPHGLLSSAGTSQILLSSQRRNSIFESHDDSPLDELGDEENFTRRDFIGIDYDNFDALRQEIVLTHVGTISAEYSNVRYPGHRKPAASHCKVFTLSAPQFTADDLCGNRRLVCILDLDEKKLTMIMLYSKYQKFDGNLRHPKNISQPENETSSLSLGPIKRIDNVIDACRIDDGEISRVLILSETEDGYGELNLQAPWSISTKVPISKTFVSTKLWQLSHQLSQFSQEENFRQPQALCGLRNSRPGGRVDLLDEQGRLHQICISLKPKDPHIFKIIEGCREILSLSRDFDSQPLKSSDGLLVCWWNAMQWIQINSFNNLDPEWSALCIILLASTFGVHNNFKSIPDVSIQEKSSLSKPLYGSTTFHQLHYDWELMQEEEACKGNPLPPWVENSGWVCLIDNIAAEFQEKSFMESISKVEQNTIQTYSFAYRYVKLAREYARTDSGRKLLFECLPTWANNTAESRSKALENLCIGLHLLREEQKLDIMTSDCFNTGSASLTPILMQIVKWLGWSTWIKFYEIEEALLTISEFDNNSPFQPSIPQPFECPSVYDWIQACVTSQYSTKFRTISDLFVTNPLLSGKNSHNRQMRLTPRTLVLNKFFDNIYSNCSPAHYVEALSNAGADSLMLETLPEAILAPIQEAMIQCQAEPPSHWSSTLLTLVGREDINLSLSLGKKPREVQSTALISSHESSLDVHSICLSISETESTGSFDGSAENDRQSISRTIFSDDRRMNEVIQLLDTTHPTIAICKAEPHWSDSELLEAQKEHVQVLANRTLAIPSGRGLLYFSARIPFLTQKWHISGFNLSCIIRPDNNTIAADKTAFTEEKVCWAFFHAGVAAGLQISRDSKGIDTSWILFNKPSPDLLNNRHAGFLLALGLNGHLKSVAKWVSFKYLTPKHTMTSIGLLLGLAASYLGTMDSLITRLLSVHVTRMLPPGAAELNLSSLTQTTGIMGIGLLYCNTQHRRMSEIMVSEIEHIDNDTGEESLRNEGYRLAAGFALGFINLGKGTDLKGLHDMKLTERLLSLATGNKKVDIVHVLDKATAAAVVGIALIFMKSENSILARKINAPDSILQYDYVRPDILLLRTVASHLIMWSMIDPCFQWIEKNLPKQYRSRSKLSSVTSLTTDDLPLYDIIAGLCFSIALRFAGSACPSVRDLLVYYLDQLMRICRIEAVTYDAKLTRNTVRNCQDLMALSVATVMAGTGDLTVLRRLRSLHGRDDGETSYGSHLAAHIAIGALFLGGGTFTFGTSNIAIAALLLAFYPIFPNSVHDNKGHLQAFRHFWALAAEPRCLVTKDIYTNKPTSVPISITLRNGDQLIRHSPCLLPEFNLIKYIRTNTPDFWNLLLDLESNPYHMKAFKSTQTIFVRRRPAHTSALTPFQSTLLALNNAENVTSNPLEWIFKLAAFESLSQAERALVIPPDRGGASDLHARTSGTVVDARLIFEHATLESGRKDRLFGLKLLFDWADKAANDGRNTLWIRKEIVERLKVKVWTMI